MIHADIPPAPDSSGHGRWGFRKPSRPAVCGDVRPRRRGPFERARQATHTAWNRITQRWCCIGRVGSSHPRYHCGDHLLAGCMVVRMREREWWSGCVCGCRGDVQMARALLCVRIQTRPCMRQCRAAATVKAHPRSGEQGATTHTHTHTHPGMARQTHRQTDRQGLSSSLYPPCV